MADLKNLAWKNGQRDGVALTKQSPHAVPSATGKQFHHRAEDAPVANWFRRIDCSAAEFASCIVPLQRSVGTVSHPVSCERKRKPPMRQEM
ncbi:hypothetical protein ZHAS_00011421 [Anopheles sinensis]|uniref:Uncharacterized protein n=1 Tax=Anopheles sinensis TaxID=74873 RepID=A0A084W0E7_ANOSI|nr:hypothetical protein ZHAS_00011421 [Anopheles sinensis]